MPSRRHSDSRHGSLTIFSCPKPFRGHIGVIQRNAIESWTRLQPRPEIILVGDEAGVHEICAELDLVHLAEIACNEHGTPLLHDIFARAEARATHEVLGWINTDIILLSDFVPAVRQAAAWRSRFLMIGQRWNLDVAEALAFGSRTGEDELRRLVARDGTPHWITGVDYYVYERGAFEEIPPFAIGRTAYDRWMIWRARALAVPVIDASRMVTCVHQNHDRTYTSIGRQPMEGNDQLTTGAESQRNVEIMEEVGAEFFDLHHATHLMTPRMMLPIAGYNNLRRFIFRTLRPGWLRPRPAGENPEAGPSA